MRSVPYLSIIAFILVSFLSAQPPSEIYQKIAPAVVRIETDRGGGTGFIVDSDGIIATAYHVVESVGNVRITLQSGEISIKCSW